MEKTNCLGLLRLNFPWLRFPWSSRTRWKFSTTRSSLTVEEN